MGLSEEGEKNINRDFKTLTVGLFTDCYGESEDLFCNQ